MSKSLKTIQLLSKIGRILSTIVFICSIIGVAGCVLGAVTLSLGWTETFKIGGVTVHGLIENSAEMSIGSLYATMAAGGILSAGECVIAKFSELYFKHELSDGTPFTFAGAKELHRLGIIAIAVSIGSIVLASIVHAIMAHAMTGVGEMNLDSTPSIGIGITFIIMSVIFKYGAEQAQPEGQKAFEKPEQ